MLDRLKIGNCAGVELRCVHLPLAITWLAEKLGGETEDRANEFCVHGTSGELQDEELGARTSPCASPIPISALRAPSPSSTRLPDGGVSSCAGGVGEETTRGATRCADACGTWLLDGIGGAEVLAALARRPPVGPLAAPTSDAPVGWLA